MAPGQACCTLTDEKGIISEEIQPSTLWTGDRSPLARGADYIPGLPWLTAPKKYIAIHTRVKFHAIAKQEHPEADGHLFQEKHPMNQTPNNTDLRNVNKN